MSNFSTSKLSALGISPSEVSVRKGNIRGYKPTGEKYKKAIEEWNKRSKKKICPRCGEKYSVYLKLKSDNTCEHL